MDDRRLTVITGGTRGIGAAIAVRLARCGHDLVLGYRSDDESAQRLAERLQGSGVACDLVRADVTTEAGLDELFGHVPEGRSVTGLVNNAGATLRIADLADTPVEIIREVIDLNLTSAVLGCRRGVRAMSTRFGGRGGAVVNISSSAATLGSPHEYVHYAAAKAGVDALTVGLAKEVAAEGVRVNSVAPGLVNTRIHADAGEPDRPERVVARVPAGRAGRPEDVAGAVSWLLGDEAAYTSGAVLRVAGGL